MKEKLELLWELQNLEAGLQESSVPEKTELKELRALKKRAEDLKADYEKMKLTLDQGVKQKNRTEAEVETLKGKREEVERSLYSENHQSAKELEQLQRKMATIDQQVGVLEDGILEEMEEVELIRTKLKSLREDLEGAVKEFRESYREYKMKEDKQEQSRRALGEKIEALKMQIGEEALEWFNQGRNRFPEKRLISSVINGSCDGCNMVISFDLKKRLKTENGDMNLTCENCGRVIFARE